MLLSELVAAEAPSQVEMRVPEASQAGQGPAPLERESTNAEVAKREEVETDVALHAGRKGDSEPEVFLSNINVGFAMADAEQNGVSEVHPAPRVAEVVSRMGLKSGWALDICTKTRLANRGTSPKQQ